VAHPRPILVYYEHPDWFRPLFAELERRGLRHLRVDASRHQFDPASGLLPTGRGSRFAPAAPEAAESRARANGHALVFNRMSPSAWKRGRAHAILYTLHYLRYLEAIGAPVVNGLRAFTVETSKALQLSLITRLGLRAPRTRVVNHPAALPAAAEGLGFPLVVKPNIGGSGAGITRFDTPEELEAAVAQESIVPSLDGILLLQEFHRPIGDSIVRVETLEGRYLYGIRVHIGAGAGFDLCPADICKDAKGATLESSACPAGAAKAGLAVERFDPPDEIREEVERIARASHLDVGGIEYLESRRDGWRYYYDVNALSNFVADPVRVVGFDPTVRLVDALVERASAKPPASSAPRGKRVRGAHRAAPAPPAPVHVVAVRPERNGTASDTPAPPAPGHAPATPAPGHASAPSASGTLAGGRP
jgi:glutathione synthase/RimK-type ligase-like ATP-grasp enzyme